MLMMLKQLGMEVAWRVVAENATYWQICAAWAGTGVFHVLTKAKVAVPVSAISSVDVLLKGMRSIVEYLILQMFGHLRIQAICNRAVRDC